MSKESDRLPVQIDPFRLALARREYDGNLSLTHFKRLGQSLTDNDGLVQVSLAFGTETVGVDLSYVHGLIKADLMIQCQRCLEPMKFPVDMEFSIAFVHTDNEAEAVPVPYEPFVVDELPITLLDLIEDEILLFLPGIARHELDECPAKHWIAEDGEDHELINDTLNNGGHSGKSENPFSVLAQLKTPDKGK